MNKPLLKQFGILTDDDFEEHPVWIACSTVDYDEAWYDETDEETFRPRAGELPADPAEGILLVSATATLSDGTTLPAFITPDAGDGDVATMQPYVLVDGVQYGFWRAPEDVRQDFHATLDKEAADVFPVRVTARPGLVAGAAEAVIPEWLPQSAGRKLRGLFRGGRS